MLGRAPGSRRSVRTGRRISSAAEIGLDARACPGLTPVRQDRTPHFLSMMVRASARLIYWRSPLRLWPAGSERPLRGRGALILAAGAGAQAELEFADRIRQQMSRARARTIMERKCGVLS